MEHKFLIDRPNLLLFEYYKEHDYTMKFKVYDIGLDEKGIPIHFKECEIVPIEEAEVLIHGGIKWDGCVNFLHPGEKEGMSHECGNPAKKLMNIWNTLYMLAAEMMPEHRDRLV